MHADVKRHPGGVENCLSAFSYIFVGGGLGSFQLALLYGMSLK